MGILQPVNPTNLRQWERSTRFESASEPLISCCPPSLPLTDWQRTFPPPQRAGVNPGKGREGPGFGLWLASRSAALTCGSSLHSAGLAVHTAGETPEGAALSNAGLCAPGSCPCQSPEAHARGRAPLISGSFWRLRRGLAVQGGCLHEGLGLSADVPVTLSQ